MNEAERSGRPGELAIDYHFCHGFYVSPCSTEIAERSSGAGIFQTSGSQLFAHAAVAAEREDAGRFIVHADQELPAFLELESAIHTDRHDHECDCPEADEELAAQIQKMSAQLEASKPAPQVVNNP